MSCHESQFDNVQHIDTLRSWIADAPVVIGIRTSLGNGDQLHPPAVDEQDLAYVEKHVAYRALSEYFSCDTSFVAQAARTMPNLTLTAALRAIVLDARAKAGVDADKKVLVALTIDEIQHGLAGTLADEPRVPGVESRKFIRHLISTLINLMTSITPYFLVPMIVGLSYSHFDVLINPESSTRIVNLIPTLLTQQGMWRVIRKSFPTFAVQLGEEDLHKTPLAFRTTLACIGGYPRGLEAWVSASSHLFRMPTDDVPDQLARQLAAKMYDAIAILPLPSLEPSLESWLPHIFEALAWTAMRNQPIDDATLVNPKFGSLTWGSVQARSGIASRCLNEKKALAVPAMLVMAWHRAMTAIHSAKGTQPRRPLAMQSLETLLRSCLNVDWSSFKEFSANYIAFLLASACESQGRRTSSLAQLLFPFAQPGSFTSESGFSTVRVRLPTYGSSYVVHTLERQFPNHRVGRGSMQLIFDDRQVVINASKAPFGESFVVLEVAKSSRTNKCLRGFPFFDTAGRTLEQVIQQNEPIDIVVCFQNKCTASHQVLSPNGIELEWYKLCKTASTYVASFPRPFILTMVVLSNTKGCGILDKTMAKWIRQYNSRGSTFVPAMIKQAECLSEFRSLQRPFVVVAASTLQLRNLGYSVVSIEEFIPRPLMRVHNGMHVMELALVHSVASILTSCRLGVVVEYAPAQ